MMDAETILRKLAWHAQHDPVYMTGVSEQRFSQIREFLLKAEQADPGWFAHPFRGGDAEARKNLRYLSALIPGYMPNVSLASTIQAVVNNARLSREDIHDILRGTEANEVDGMTLQHAGSLLRAGHTKSAVAETVGLDRATVRDLARWLGTDEAREDALREHAMRFLERGESKPEVLAAETGCTLKKARDLLNEVREGLAHV